ncbi:hypothetical protein N2152v2_004991 [Parachlorella kessleri]
MVATAVCQAVSKPSLARKTFGTAVAAKPSQAVCRVNRRVECSAQKKQEALVAGVTVGVAAMMANPLVAEAAVTPSLKNLLNSLIAGGLVLGLIAVAITGVANFDPVNRK